MDLGSATLWRETGLACEELCSPPWLRMREGQREISYWGQIYETCEWGQRSGKNRSLKATRAGVVVGRSRIVFGCPVAVDCIRVNMNSACESEDPDGRDIKLITWKELSATITQLLHALNAPGSSALSWDKSTSLFLTVAEVGSF